MKFFCFTVDDNIRFFKDITENNYESIFDHPYLKMYKRLHEKFNLKVQLNLFYRLDDFTLSDFSDKYSKQWQENSDWLKLSFHAENNKSNPYMNSGYDEVFADCKKVHNEILRFAHKNTLAKTTTVHCCRTTSDGLNALKDNNISGLLGLWAKGETPRVSYEIDDDKIYDGEIVKTNSISFSKIDIILNMFTKEKVLTELENLKDRDFIKIMIHEQYFYPDYKNHQPDFEEKISLAFEFLTNNNYKSVCFEEML